MASRNFSRIPQFRPQDRPLQNRRSDRLMNHATFRGVRETFERGLANLEVFKRKELEFRAEVDWTKEKFFEILGGDGTIDYEDPDCVNLVNTDTVTDIGKIYINNLERD